MDRLKKYGFIYKCVHAIIPIVIAIVCLRIIFVHYYQLPPSSNFKNNINYSIEKNISLSQQFFRQGLLAYQNRRYQVAHQLLLNATKTDPFYADAYYNIAIVEETIFHKFESALKHYEQTICIHDVEVEQKLYGIKLYVMKTFKYSIQSIG